MISTLIGVSLASVGAYAAARTWEWALRKPESPPELDPVRLHAIATSRDHSITFISAEAAKAARLALAHHRAGNLIKAREFGAVATYLERQALRRFINP